MFPAFRNALSRGGKDEQEAFRILIQSRKFKSEFGDMLEREYGEQNAQGLVEAYKSCMNKGEKRQALLLLSTYSSCHPRSQTMSRFECSVRQVQNANMLWRLRHVPEDTKSVHKYSTFSRETVIHAEAFSLRQDKVLRVPFSKGPCSDAFLLRAPRNRMFLKYKDECLHQNIKPMGRTSFFKFYGESIFKNMTRVRMCRVRVCVPGPLPCF